MSFRTREGGPDLSYLERQLGDVLVEEEIARTPRAVIYRIRSGREEGRLLALKLALEPGTPEDLARFRHEARLLSEVRHPNVVEVYDYGVLPGDFPFLTMELVTEGSVASRIGEGDWKTFFKVAIQAAAGLAHIHRHGVVHLDVKPDNLGIAAGDDLQLKILDFGLAQSGHAPIDRRIRGTLAYVAPEILLQDSWDHRADLYSLGMTLFELATAVLPSAGDDMTAIRFHLEGEVPDPLRYRPDMPRELAEILRRLLERDPHRRFPSAGNLLVELGKASGAPVDSAELVLGRDSVLASRLVGRETVLEGLRHRLAEATEGRGGIVVVEGSEGTGKSRLLREFRLQALVEGATVATGRALAERPEPLRPVLEVLRRLDPDGATVDTSRGEDEGLSRYTVHRQLADRLLELARSAKPLVLLLEDLDAGGRETLEMLGFLVPEVVSARILIVATINPASADTRAARDLTGRDGVVVLRLAPLGRSETCLLVDASLGAEALPEAFYDWVHEYSGGLPGRIQQLLRHLVDERVLRFRQGKWKPSLPGLARVAELPGGLAELEQQRLTHLPTDELQALEVAAILAEPFSIETLAVLLEETPQGAYGRLSALVDQGYLERTSGEGTVLYFQPRSHERLAVYEKIDIERRRELHGRVADQVEKRLEAGEKHLVTSFADHLWRAGERDRALAWLLEAARMAAGVSGHADAASLYARAAEVLDEQGQGDEASLTRELQAEALRASGDYPRALRLYQDLLEADKGGRRAADRRLRAARGLQVGSLYGRLGEHDVGLEAFETALTQVAGIREPELEIDLLHGKCSALIEMGRRSEAFETARAALRRASDLGLHRQRARLLDTLGRVFRARGDWQRAERLVRRALRAAATAGDDRLAVSLRDHLGKIRRRIGDADGAHILFRANLEACRGIHDLWGELTASSHLGLLELGRCNWRGAREYLDHSLEMERRFGAREAEARTRLGLGEIEEALGDWPESRRHYDRAFKLLAASPEHPDRVAAILRLASLSRKQGKVARAEDLLADGLAGAERSRDPELEARGHFELGLLEKDRERWEVAATALERALSLSREAAANILTGRVHTSLADLALRRGLSEAAEEHAAEAHRLAEELGDRFGLGKALSVEARVAVAKDEPDLAERFFSQGIRLLEDLEVPYEYARSLYEWGIRTWNPDISVERLDRAFAAFERLGAATEVERVRGAVERVRERQRFEVSRRSLPGLWEVVKVINSSLDLDEVLSQTMDLVLERLRAERGMLVLADQLTGELEVKAARNLGKDPTEESHELSETVVRQVIEKGEPVLAVDALSDHRFAASDSIVASSIRSLLCVPLAIRDRRVGAIYLDHCESRHLFGKNDLAFLLAFADQAAIAIENARLYQEIQGAKERLSNENESLRREILSSRHLGSLIGKSRSIVELKSTLERVAPGDSTVLIRGESGTGKGLVARILHSISSRRKGSFVHFNCAALPETLVESELFGYERGAFTGATGLKPGRFELAHKGTIFLDEIGKISLSVQSKLLRVVEDKEFERIGGTKTLRSDVRIVAATNLDLEEAIKRNEFREDLYYRLNIIPVILAPLRERREDILYLAQHFLEKIGRDLGLPSKELDPSVLDLFMSHGWPGNVRELEAAIHRSLVLSRNDILGPEDFSWIAGGDNRSTTSDIVPAASTSRELGQGGYQRSIENFDRLLLIEALEQSDGKIREAARLLGIARNTLKAKIQKLGIEVTKGA